MDLNGKDTVFLKASIPGRLMGKAGSDHRMIVIEVLELAW